MDQLVNAFAADYGYLGKVRSGTNHLPAIPQAASYKPTADRA
eukprot:SAG31_NODE_34414_length_333_cov_0.824786_1_plen_41_part_10